MFFFAKAKVAIMAVHMVRLRQRFFHHNKCGCSHGAIATKLRLSLTQSIKAHSHSAILMTVTTFSYMEYVVCTSMTLFRVCDCNLQ